MKIKSHQLRVRYLFYRVLQWFYFRYNPDKPWMCKEVNQFLINHIKPHMSILEYGCGSSTKFYATYAKAVVSIETNKNWYDLINTRLSDLNNVQLKLVKDDKFNYVQNFEANSFDIVVNDASHRELVSISALDVLKSGGILIIDNAERYIKSPYLSLPAEGQVYNNHDDPRVSIWKEFTMNTKDWKSKWYTDNVNSTLVLIKP